MGKICNRNIHLPGTKSRRGHRSVKHKTGIALTALAAMFLGLAPISHAQSDAPTNDEPVIQEPNGTGNQSAAQPGTSTQAGVHVVRLSDVEGMVQILREDKTQFPQAVMNMPLAEGSQINTGADGRAEIEFEDGSVARITPNSSLSITQLQSTGEGALETNVQQLSGLIYYELRNDPKRPFKVMFDGRTVAPAVNSTFRINLGIAPPELAVIDGGVQVNGTSDGYTAEVHQGKTIKFQSSDSAKYTIADGITPNGFDEWNDQRDQEAAQEAQNQTPARMQQGGGSVMDGGIGWSDLDNAGGWYPLPGYGMVWQPYGVGADFDPYDNGMWADFGGSFGYSWVSGYPWGWLPFHYGMWSYIGGFGWGWLPCNYPGGGFGYGGFGFRGQGYGGLHNRLYTNIYRGPAGYHSPVPPTIARGAIPARIVPVGSQHGGTVGSNRREAALNVNHATGGHFNAGQDNRGNSRTVRFEGGKIAPLHSMMSGVRVPTRNAALYNNYPTRAFHGDIRTAMRDRSSGAIHSPGTTFDRNSIGHGPGRSEFMRSGNLHGENIHANRGGSGGSLRGPMSANQSQQLNAARGNSFTRNSFGTQNRAFGRQTSFGSRGGFGREHPGFQNGGGFRSGGRNFQGGGNAGRFGGPSNSGFHGGASRPGGFNGGASHGGGVSRGGGFSGSGGHAAGGGFSGGGGGHAGGGFSGGGGGGHTGGGFSGGGGHGR